MSDETKNPLFCDPETGVCEVPDRSPETSADTSVAHGDKPLQVVYFTDPICSSCWGIEPQLRKLKLEYGHVLDFDYRMGGLLPDWNYNSGGISGPEDVAAHWDEVSHYYRMPIDGDVWLEDPLHSSYPPSVAFKAAQMQDKAKAIDFLRAMRELLFLRKKNITKWEHLAQAAESAGLEVDRLKKDYENGTAQELFEADLYYARRMGARGFPSIFFVDGEERREFVYGSRPYDRYEEAIRNLLPDVEKKPFDASLEALMQTYRTLSPKEYSVLADIHLGEAERSLETETDKGRLQRVATKNGNLYTRVES